MPIDYTCLGKTEKVQTRRYHVLQYYLKNATTTETFDALSKEFDYTRKQIENDVFHIKHNTLNNLPAEMFRDMKLSWFELKIRELEGNSKRLKPDSPSWLKLQKLILDYETTLLKLGGLMSEKVELSGSVSHPIEYVPAKKPDDTKPTDAED